MLVRPLILIAVAAGLSACQTSQSQMTQSGATLPASAVVEAPAEGVPAEYAAFSGVWSGQWGNCLPGKLAVTKIEPSGAVHTVYSWGDCAQWDISAGWSEHSGEIEGDTLRLNRFPNGAQVEYTMQPDGSLAGTYERDGRITSGRFTES